MRVYISLILLMAALFKTGAYREVDYYWKDYDGEVPTDAFQAGTDYEETPIYIGQALFKDVGLLPGTLHPNSTDMKIAAQGKVFTTNKNVKILCSENPLKLRWLNLPYEYISTLANSHPLIGGSESNTVVYIGRIKQNGSDEIGKISNVAPNQGLALPNDQEEESRYKQFDMLMYKVDAPTWLWQY